MSIVLMSVLLGALILARRHPSCPAAEQEQEGERLERTVSFERQIPLPDGVDSEQAQAPYRNGVLSIRFPEQAERSNARPIPITTESSAQQKAA
jgi:HSP20 family molecular chaperone IbpA